MTRALIVSRNDYLARWTAACLSVAKVDVHVLAHRNWGLARLSRYCRVYSSHDSLSPRMDGLEFARHVERYCQLHRVDWVVPVDVASTVLLGRFRRQLRSARLFPIADPDLVELWNDKWEFGQKLLELGLPMPRTWRIRSASDPVIRELPFPLVVKPVLGEGGVGVRAVANLDLLSALLPRHGELFGWPLLLQEYIPGRDIDLSVLADRGRIVAWTIQKPRGDVLEHLDFIEHPEILAIGTKLVGACAYHGIAHFDMRLDARTSRPVVLESNPRMWESCRQSAWMGVNFPSLGLSLAAGEDLGPLFKPVFGPCRDPGLQIKSALRGLLRGRGGPEHLSGPTREGWRMHWADPLPEVWRRLRTAGVRRRVAVL